MVSQTFRPGPLSAAKSFSSDCIFNVSIETSSSRSLTRRPAGLHTPRRRGWACGNSLPPTKPAAARCRPSPASASQLRAGAAHRAAAPRKEASRRLTSSGLSCCTQCELPGSTSTRTLSTYLSMPRSSCRRRGGVSGCWGKEEGVSGSGGKEEGVAAKSRAGLGGRGPCQAGAGTGGGGGGGGGCSAAFVHLLAQRSVVLGPDDHCRHADLAFQRPARAQRAQHGAAGTACVQPTSGGQAACVRGRRRRRQTSSAASRTAAGRGPGSARPGR